MNVELKNKTPEKGQTQRCVAESEDTRIILERPPLPPNIVDVKGMRLARDGDWTQYTFVAEIHKGTQKAPAIAKAPTAVHCPLQSLTWQPTYRDSVLTAVTDQSHCAMEPAIRLPTMSIDLIEAQMGCVVAELIETARC